MTKKYMSSAKIETNLGFKFNITVKEKNNTKEKKKDMMSILQ